MLTTPVPFRDLDELRRRPAPRPLKAWQRGAPPPHDTRLEYTALHNSVYNCRIKQVKLLVSKCSANVNSKDRLGRTPLMLCCRLDNQVIATKMAKIFLSAGALLGPKDIKGRNALAYACVHGRLDMVLEMLREEAADLTEPDNDGNTPLHHAAIQGNPAIVNALVSEMKLYSASADPRNVLGYTPLMLAAKHGNWQAAAMILVHAGASGFLRENEHFRNALDWVRVGDMKNKKSVRVVKTAQPALSGHSQCHTSRTPAFLTQRSATTLQGGSGNFYEELVREVTFTYGVRTSRRALPQLPSAASALISQVPTSSTFFNKFGGLRQDEQLTVDYVPLNAVDEEDDENLNILEMTAAEARELLLDRLERQECAPGGQPRGSFGGPRAPSRPQTSVLRARAPQTTNTSAENIRFLLNMVHGQNEALKSAQLIREETGFTDDFPCKSSSDFADRDHPTLADTGRRNTLSKIANQMAIAGKLSGKK